MYRSWWLGVVLSVTCVLASNSVAWAQGVVGQGRVATIEGQGANAWSGNIRASDDELVALLDDGIKRSPTFKGLVDRLAKSDVILYVRPDVTAKSSSMRLTFLAAKGGYRYLVIRVGAGRSKDQQLATLGHEMQHAVIVADAASVVDSASLRREFERIGKLTQAPIGDDFFFESAVAEAVRRRILAEVSQKQ
jgi:hypothetical protein